MYSSFLQRSYDMLLHDVALQKLHVVLAVDRAGLVGEDGETHHGVFDPAFLDTIPGMTVLCPSSFQELREMLRYAIYDVEGQWQSVTPGEGRAPTRATSRWSQPPCCGRERTLPLAGYGMMLNQLLDCADRLARNGIQAEVVKLNAITPIPLERLTASVQKTGRLLVAEDSAAAGGVGQRIAAGLFGWHPGASWPWRIPDTPLLPMERCPSFKGCAVWTGRAYITEHWSSEGLPSWLM